MKRLSVEEKELDRAAGISLSSVLIERWISHLGQLAAHYQTKTWMKTVRIDINL